MKRHLKIMTLPSVLLAIILLSACAKNASAPKGIVQKAIGIEDGFQCPVMETEYGYYYNQHANYVYELHYLDKATGKDVILCNKPECKHDGNEFCVGTNSKYIPFSFQLYDGDIYMAAICDGNGTHDFKLLRISADGSSLTEVATLYSVNSATNNHPSKYLDNDFCMIHRGMALFQICIGGNDQMEDAISYGAFIYDLNSGERTPLFSEELDVENPALQEISARGDSFYFVTLDGKKHLLRKYSTESKTEEILELLTNFTGDYAVLNDGTVFYLRSMKSKLAIRRPDGKNEETEKFQVSYELFLDKDSVPSFLSPEWYAPSITLVRDLYANKLLTDGNTLIVAFNHQSAYGDYYPIQLPAGKEDLTYYVDPETGEYVGMDSETGEPTAFAQYETPNGCVLLSQYDSRGIKLQDFQVQILPKNYETDQKIYVSQETYVNSGKVLCEIKEVNLNASKINYYYVEQDLADFLSEKAFPEPLLTISHP